MSTSTDRMRHKRDRERLERHTLELRKQQDALIIAGAQQASREKHESPSQCEARIERALAYADWRDKSFLAGECASPARPAA